MTETETTPEPPVTYAALAAQARELTYGEWTTQTLGSDYTSLRHESHTHKEK
jgi:hypothetical protein